MIVHAASEPFDPTSAWTEPPGLGRALKVGVLVGVVCSFVGVGGAFLIGGQGLGPAIGMGAFVATWGGVGFGVMVGGVVWATRVDEAAERDRRATRAAAAAITGSS